MQSAKYLTMMACLVAMVTVAPMAPTVAQVVSIRITADPDRIAGIVGAIDVKSLATKVPN